MLRAALIFFVIGIVAYFLGAGGIAGLSIDIGKTLLWVFVALAALTAITGLFFADKARKTLP